MLYLDKYSNRRLMKGREHPHFLLSTITANLFVYAQAFEFFFFKFAARNAGFLREVTVKIKILNHSTMYKGTVSYIRRPAIRTI